MYGCHDLRRDDIDRDPSNGNAPKWGGIAGAPNATPGCPAPPLAAAPGSAAVVAVPQHVRKLQEDLRSLGFSVVGAPSGTFDLHTEWAVRELQIYAKMPHVARVSPTAPANAQQGAHLVTALGQHATQLLSIYVASLEQAGNGAIYAGAITGVVDGATRDVIEHWLAHNFRCPVIVEAWSIRAGARSSLTQSNIWRHDDLASSAPRMFVRDFSDHYAFPPTKSSTDMQPLGEFVTFGAHSGPRSEPPHHTWPEAEVTPDALIGRAALSAAETSTFKVVRSVSEVECIGFLDCVNSYDNAFLSMGPCHWTLGIESPSPPLPNVAPGELCGYLSYLRQIDPAAFSAAIEFFGVRATPDWAHGGVANGAALFVSTQRKYAGRMARVTAAGAAVTMPDSINEWLYFKTWHWFYRFVMAGRTNTGYRRRIWDMARIRLRDIRNTPWGRAGVANVGTPPHARPATIGDVFTSEKASAIILRWHVRFPAHVVSALGAAAVTPFTHSSAGAGSHLDSALGRARSAASTLTWTGDPSLWTDDHERALVQGLLDEVAAVGNAELQRSVGVAAGFPVWSAGHNPRGFRLTAPLTPHSDHRNSFDFDAAGLPPAPP